MIMIHPGTFINQTHLHIFQLLPQCISEVTNFQHLQMCWMIQSKDYHLKFMVCTIVNVVLTTTFKANYHLVLIYSYLYFICISIRICVSFVFLAPIVVTAT